jgi:hypothetical protein
MDALNASIKVLTTFKEVQSTVSAAAKTALMHKLQELVPLRGA